MSCIRRSIALALLTLFTWVAPASAEELIDVIEIDDLAQNPVIFHENILPGDSFADTISVKNLKTVSFDIAMNLDIDTSKGIWNFDDDKLEEAITVKVKRSNGTFVILPGPGNDDVATLQELDGTTILLGSVAGGVTEVYTVLSAFDINAGNEYQNTKVYFNLDIGVEVVGETPRLLLTKINDSVSDETPGNEVVYTLQVTAPDGPVDDVLVTDLPPEGFDYVAGSGAGAPFLHEYASPGVWNVGDMDTGETKVLTYKTKISGSQDAGLYRDIAFARGTANGGAILANAEAAEPFVGTQVNVVLNTNPTVALDEEEEEEVERKTKTKTQYVLGASTLPLTGTSALLVLGALVLIGVGGVFLFLSKKNRAPLAIVAFALVMLPGIASAASLSVEIETPEAVVNTTDFKIGFATLDVLGRSLEVECYTTLSALPFATYPLESSFGGNAGDCQVNNSVVPTDGNYEFFVRAKALGEAPETVESEHVTVTVATSVPGTPTNYDRDDDSCQAYISFRTANDSGKTVKVELYRSEENPFVANSSTKVDEQVIGSDTEGNFTNALPDCDEDIFYALRAVDVYGHGSGFVGDIEVDTETVTETKTKINTVVIPGQASGALPAASGAQSGGSVQGAATDVSGEDAEEAPEGAGEVLGEATEGEGETLVGNWLDTLTKHPWWTTLGLISIALLLWYGYKKRSGRTPDASIE